MKGRCPPITILAELKRLGYQVSCNNWNKRANMWECATSGEVLVRVWDTGDKTYRLEFFKMWTATNISL